MSPLFSALVICLELTNFKPGFWTTNLLLLQSGRCSEQHAAPERFCRSSGLCSIRVLPAPTCRHTPHCTWRDELVGDFQLCPYCPLTHIAISTLQRCCSCQQRRVNDSWYTATCSCVCALLSRAGHLHSVRWLLFVFGIGRGMCFLPWVPCTTWITLMPISC